MGKGLPVIDFGSPLFYICILFRITVKFAIESFRESLLNNAVFLRIKEQLLVGTWAKSYRFRLKIGEGANCSM